MKKYIFFLFVVLNFWNGFTQNQTINWISFEQLEDSLAKKPKKVLISFYADWCTYCKKMDASAYKDSKVIALINSDYYAVKMNSETKDTITFDGRKFFNKNIGKSRNPTHEIPLLLAKRKNRPFSLPATIILDKNFKIKKRDFEYISTKRMLEFLKD